MSKLSLESPADSSHSAALVGLVAAAGTAYATIRQRRRSIHACYSRSDGSLRVIDRVRHELQGVRDGP